MISNSPKATCCISFVALVCTLVITRPASAQSTDTVPKSYGRITARVPAAMEIQILDPGRSPDGSPQVQLSENPGFATQVEIPPSIIVHRYYYTGDRTFRGPVFPGGPSIIVVNHPRTGERCYIEAAMLPGSPEIHYSQNRIEYDFGNRAVILTFPRWGGPALSVRNGRPITEKISHALHLEKVRSAASGVQTAVKTVAAKTHTAVKGTGQLMGNVARPITLPMQNIARMMPGAAALTDPNLSAKVAQEQALRQQQTQAARASQLPASLDIPRL